MNILAMLVAMVAGALAAVVVCKAVKLKLYVEILAFIGCLCAFWAADKLAPGMDTWNLGGLTVGFLAVVLWLRHVARRDARRVA